MGPLNLVLLVAGAALIVVGVVRARTPYRRYMALKDQDANIARYEAVAGRGPQRRQDRRLGRDAGPPASGPDRRCGS